MHEKSRARIGVVSGLPMLVALLLAAPIAAVDVFLVAKPATKTLPDGVVVPMWGFAEDADGNLATDGFEAASVPGPAFDVVGSGELTVHLRNDLDVPVSLVIMGQEMPVSGCGATPVWTDGTAGPRGGDPSKRVRSFGCEAAPHGTQTYAWSAASGNPLDPGSFVYQSGTHPQVQVQMGLYGAVRAKPSDGEVYPGVGFDHEADLLFSEIDPALHAAVDAESSSGGVSIPRASSTLHYQPRYFLINGEAQEATGGRLSCTAPVAGPLRRNDVILLRLMNAGLQDRAPMLGTGRWTLVGDGGHPLARPRDQYSAFLQAGSTKDVLFSSASTGRFPILDRRLDLTNHMLPDGGMQTCVRIGSGCGIGFELALLLPWLTGLRRRRLGQRP